MSNKSISILAVDDEEAFTDVLEEIFSEEGYRVQVARDGTEAINAIQAKFFDLVLLDMKLPRVDGIEVLRFIRERYLDTQVIMLTGLSDVRLAVECMRIGAFHYLTKPLTADELMTVVERALERKRLVIENKVLKSELARRASTGSIVGSSTPMLELLNTAARVAPTDSPVLIEGANGTGKELIATFLHQNSLRREGQFVALSCASLPEALLESELFGHEKGAFADAVATKQGLVEIASGGTLFLDEIAEMNVTLQPKLLWFLQTGEYRRVGGSKNLRSDVRVISATNKSLDKEIVSGGFREDLLNRINVITLKVPLLRDRTEDISALVDHFLRTKARPHGLRKIEPNALEMLIRYDWPGNVRELENVIERASILCEDNLIRVEHIALPMGRRPQAQHQSSGEPAPSILGTAVSMREVEGAHIAGVLSSVNWNKATAAQILGISLKTLYTKVQQHNLTKE